MQFHPCPMLMAQVLIPCWIHFYLPSLTKLSSDIWTVDLFLLIIDDMAALDCILNSSCNLPAPFYVHVLKTNSASSNKDNPLAISCIVNLSGFSITSSSCPSSSFLWASNSMRSSLVSSSCHTARTSMKPSLADPEPASC